MAVIQTLYHGVYFRSRLEARWAVFFDELGILWEYEKEGYEFSDGSRYLPDFWLPELKIWVEIKGEQPTEEEERKMDWLVVETGHSACIFFGNIPNGEYQSEYPFWFGGDGTGCDVGYEMTQCPECGIYGIVYSGWAHRLSCDCYDEDRRCKSPDMSGVYRAYDIARSARFEHGEKGTVVYV